MADTAVATETKIADPTPNPQPEPAPFDYAALGKELDDKVEAGAVAAKEPVKAPETTGTKPEDAADAGTKAPEKPAEGTPDKEIQKLAQRQTSIDQRFDKIEKLIEAQGGKPTAAQVEKIAELKQEQDEIANLLKEGYAIDPYTDTTKIVKAVKGVRDEQAGAKKELEELRATVQELQAEKVWLGEEKKFEGVNVRDVWAKAQDDAITEISEEHAAAGIKLPDEQAQRVIQARATKLYNARCDAAVKSKSAKGPSKAPVSTTDHGPAHTTAGGATVSVENRSLNTAATEVDPTKSLDFYRELGRQMAGA